MSARSSPRRVLLGALLVVSGFCGLSYEVLYARLLGNSIGDQFAVNASILLTFLLGIGFGTLTAHRLWRFLWLIEGGIGVVAASFALLAGPLDAFIYTVLPAPARGLGGSVLVCAAVLAVPSFLIGSSLPLFAGYLGRLASGRAFALAYAAYNFGAALTVLVIEYWLLRRFGLRAAILLTAALNGFTAVVLRVAFGSLAADPPEKSAPVAVPRADLAALALGSIASAIFQLLMTKIAECFLGPFRETFALVLAIVLLGIAVGTALVERLRLRLDAVLAAGVLGVVWLLAGYGLVTRQYAAWYPAAVSGGLTHVLLKFGALLALMGVPAAAFGATIPAVLTAERDVARESGRLLFVSSVANAAGFLLMAFVLHRAFEYDVLLLIVAGLGALAIVVHRRAEPRALALSIVAVAAAAGVSRTLFKTDLLYLGYTAYKDTRDLADAEANLTKVERFKSGQDLFSLGYRGNAPYFFVNGYISMYLNAPHEKLVGALSSMLAPRHDKALVLGIGSGMTAGTVGVLFDRTDAVEINPAVLENVHRMAGYNFDMMQRASIHEILDDGIHYCRTTDERYTMILNTVTSPIYFSSSKLYTRDFFESVHRRLTPDGIYVTWIDRRIGDRGMDIILQTLTKTFPECWITAVRSAYFLLICSDLPIRLQQPRLLADSEVASEYLRSVLIDPLWVPYAFLHGRAYDLLGDRDAPLNTLDRPTLEFEMARLRDRGFPDFVKRMTDAQSLAEARAALTSMPRFDPVELALYTNDRLGGRSSLSARWKALASAEAPDIDIRMADARARLYERIGSPRAAARGRHKLGYALLEAGRYEAAIAEFERALALDPTRAVSRFNEGVCYERLGRHAEAVEAFRADLRLDPEDSQAYFRLGRNLGKIGQYRDAVLALGVALDLSTDRKTRVKIRVETTRVQRLMAAASKEAAPREGAR